MFNNPHYTSSMLNMQTHPLICTSLVARYSFLQLVEGSSISSKTNVKYICASIQYILVSLDLWSYFSFLEEHSLLGPSKNQNSK